MYKYILEAAGNINWMALFALLTFMIVFIVSAVLILTKNTNTIKHIAELPLINDRMDDNNS
ncbi:hypothetical protein [Portibacter lacus]|uniref:CcoQ/FixQ family Cbb3-type cytochrome c oxidase assembly chaperone n=1 Tax=Portibacter lacus TaxID=1099794 RepID=A0AA37SQ48_9BACT|nr:hypothetical protein [Portibacter lacus]GLR17184.1 hypothetical protein GCM10007940_17990 [Portibacter lacus]